MARSRPSSHWAVKFVLLSLPLIALNPGVKCNQENANEDVSAEGQVAVVPVSGDVWKPYTPTAEPSCTDEYSCLAEKMPETERLALEAIRTLHGKLDDDADGNIDLSESDEFLREELHYEGGHERRQKAFHRNDDGDMQISVGELWESWIRSEVHNWTIDQTVEWLVTFVQLPQYVSNFQQHKVNGTKLPRLAVNVQYMSSVLGVKDPIHRQKIAVKAMDVVLFGPPKENSTYYKDLTLITLVVAAAAGTWYTYRSNKHSKQHLSKLMEHLEILSSAEKELQELQLKLQHAREEQDITLSEKKLLETKLKEEAKGNDGTSQHSDPVVELELRRLREEVDILRAELQRAEGELEDRLTWSPPPELQHWLQLTYEREQRAYNEKRLQAEKQLEHAKADVEKLNRKRSSFVASFISAHGHTIDDVDKSILEARSALLEVKQDLQERTSRWRQIESLCGFSIVSNPGLIYLETLLRSGANPSLVLLNPTRRGATLDEEADETGSVVSSSTGNGLSSSLHSNSLSELPKVSTVIQRPKLNQRENSKDSAFEGSTVSSTVTGGEDEGIIYVPIRTSAVIKSSLPPPVKTEAPSSPGLAHKTLPERVVVSTNPVVALTTTQPVETGRKSPMLVSKATVRHSQPVASASQDSLDVPASVIKISQSESALDAAYHKAELAESESAQEENLSTDSSIPSVDDEVRQQKKKQRFKFPFMKRSKNKT